MAVRMLCRVVRNIVIQHPQMVNRDLDEAAREQMRQREELLRQEMARLLQELEQNDVAQRYHAMLQWHSWALALLVLLALWCWLRYFRNMMEF